MVETLADGTRDIAGVESVDPPQKGTGAKAAVSTRSASAIDVIDHARGVGGAVASGAAPH
eukprot:SAG31_NODE_382_length_16456_cov_5.532983_9_plen_60_part_00